MIAHTFCNHFKKSYVANNARRAQELKEEYLVMREKYCGFLNNDNSHFDTETISRIIIDMKRGKAADIDGLTVEHSHPVIQWYLYYYLIFSTDTVKSLHSQWF